ncbi:dual specificity mitogen-activated protein kinase kinase 1 [Paraphaeosphaeria minitans]|uniref:non-specific serine/threonine protein kinase n=1 Tax=Paraphaeosphaeria minitans TaxID=565426 RepID=A0A9P6KVY3_9PLEO|nr:dual specificity mitogen-activated protein kinase kinase 1 [Paraphaeosphaeria minitans]
MWRLASSHHVVNLHATYSAGRELALVLDPVADGGDLAIFMQGFSELQQELNRLTQLQTQKMLRTLRPAYCCLTFCLAFIHKPTIRHKDTKPQNIFIHQGNVLYTDFDLSCEHSTRGRSTTTGRPNIFTRRYCAPEVADHDRRNSKSDIPSLGCIFR